MPKASQSATNHKPNKIIAIICIVVILAVGLAVLLRGDSAAPGGSSTSSDTSLYVSPQKQSLSKGQTISVSVWAASGSQNINSVEADLSYPSDYFDFVSVDDSTSSFSLAVQGEAKDGVVSIVRGNTSALKGNALIAVINLQAKDKVGSATLSFTKNSKVFSSTTNKNVLSKTISGKYTVK